ncbi:hypothetical protein Cob_v003122 [Colletotrichum orbiculare MAFF 240422]|uniref:Uncharacterized protein n=1 Tax=Colletotrichum orbiculare (strain 104-T / ATCC 96160 / CBS 514.97 / LARS 414 / MAFF 240422) TaxID=1213857 RepID=A0A484G1V8_COLOR|nr:hypothetical protein Cob_v003122 [Colletotrichum orbiculare MAFF 240422]
MHFPIFTLIATLMAGSVSAAVTYATVEDGGACVRHGDREGSYCFLDAKICPEGSRDVFDDKVNQLNDDACHYTYMTGEDCDITHACQT